jgi:hypothetical protein
LRRKRQVAQTLADGVGNGVRIDRLAEAISPISGATGGY